MRLIVTRPEPEAARWVRDLSLPGVQPLAWPLIDIGPVDDPQPLRQAWQRVPECAAVMFVSAHAVAGFFQAKPTPGPVDTEEFATGTRAWAPGPGTARALRARGVAAHCIDSPAPADGPLDSEALWRIVQGQIRAGDQVLIVRGEDDVADVADGPHGTGRGREWLAGQLRAAGARVDYQVAYRRRVPDWSAVQCAQAAGAAADGSIWLFSSAQAVAHLQVLLPAQSWQQARALATHPRIAQAARQAGFGEVRDTSADLPALRASIESMR